MKLVKKENLKHEGAVLSLGKGELVSLNSGLESQLNALETMRQKAEWAKANPKAELPTPRPAFKRTHINEINLPYLETETPMADAEAEKALAFVKEIDKVNITEKVNKLIKEYAAIFAFVNADKVEVTEDFLTDLDTPIIGDVTKLTEADVMQILLDYADGVYHGEFK